LKGESLPTGVDASTIYFVVTVSGDTFKLALTSGGAAIDLTTTGSGTVVKSGAQTININNQFILPIGNISCSLR
jgi:acyl CoA:acetate/3-ketoacid CoA transferase alpha subunit